MTLSKKKCIILQLLTISNCYIQTVLSAWYTGLHGPGTIPDMLLQCFNKNQVPCTPLKTLAAWYDQQGGGRGGSNGGNGGNGGSSGGSSRTSNNNVANAPYLPIITYSSADGDDITTYLFKTGGSSALQRPLVDVEEINLRNATDFNVYVFCCLENHVEGGTGDS